jgi:hypothetical protein
VTGAPVRWPTPGSAVIERLQGSPEEQDVAIAGLPDRPSIYSLSLGVKTPMQPALSVMEHPLSFFRVYDYRPIRADISASGGTARFEASRTYAPMVVDALVPNDPWPESFALTVSWTCDLGATKPAPLPVPTPTQGPWTPPPSAAASPSLPAVVPIELRLVTSAESATVEVTGATVAAVDPPTPEGDATAGYADGVFGVEPSAGVAPDGRAIGASFRLWCNRASPSRRVVSSPSAVPGSPPGGRRSRR